MSSTEPSGELHPISETITNLRPQICSAYASGPTLDYRYLPAAEPLLACLLLLNPRSPLEELCSAAARDSPSKQAPARKIHAMMGSLLLACSCLLVSPVLFAIACLLEPPNFEKLMAQLTTHSEFFVQSGPRGSKRFLRHSSLLQCAHSSSSPSSRTALVLSCRRRAGHPRRSPSRPKRASLRPKWWWTPS